MTTQTNGWGGGCIDRESVCRVAVPLRRPSGEKNKNSTASVSRTTSEGQGKIFFLRASPPPSSRLSSPLFINITARPDS